MVAYQTEAPTEAYYQIIDVKFTENMWYVQRIIF